MNGWTEDESTDIRTRDLAERERTIMDGGYIPDRWVRPDWGRTEYQTMHAHPRRIDWVRVAAWTGVALAGAAAAAVLIYVMLVYVLTAF